jgi:nucleotide-binding universal stress UspA family protein
MFHTLLVPLDGSALAEQALGQAAAIAGASRAALELVLVHEPFPFDGFGDAPWSAAQVKDEETYVQSIATELATSTGLPVTCAVIQGPSVDMICRRARDVDASLIVMTSHGRTGFSRAWLGSTADGVIRHSATPVLMLPPVEGKAARLAPPSVFKRILVPLDGSALAADAVSSAIALAQSTGATITLLRVVPPVPAIPIGAGMRFPYASSVAAPDDPATRTLVDQAKKDLAEVSRRAGEQGVANVASEVAVAGNVAQTIIDFAHGHDVDVIAMSTHGRGASRLVLGSVADKVVRGSGLPALLRRPIALPEWDGITEASTVAELPALAGAPE